jgi:hypothetical protein
MIEITGALSAARALAEMAKAAIDARDDVKAKEAVANLQAKLFDATSAALAMAEKAASLQAALSQSEREKAEIKAKLDDRAAYSLHEVRAGAFVYAFQPVAGRTEPPHYLCQPCYDSGVKTVLRKSPNGTHLQCAAEARHSVQLFAQRLDYPPSGY